MSQTSKRERSKNEFSEFSEDPEPVSKMAKISTTDCRKNKFIVIVSNIHQLHELIKIFSNVASVAEVSFSSGMMFIKTMGVANISCIQAQFVCETIGLDPENYLVPFFIDLVIFELCLSTKIFSKLSSCQETFLKMVVTLNEKLTLMILNSETTASMPYVGKHKLCLLDPSQSACELSVKELEYDNTLRLSTDDFKKVLEQFMKFKFVCICFRIYRDDSDNTALRISGDNRIHSSKHTFFCHKRPGSDIICATSTPDSSDILQAASKPSANSGEMKLIYSQSFYCQHLWKLTKVMNDHYVRLCFSNELPLCIVYHFTTNSYLRYFLCSMAEDCDNDAVANMPQPKASAKKSAKGFTSDPNVSDD